MQLDDLCDYIILKVLNAGEELSQNKLHKLIYYCEAYYQALYDRELIQEDFQARIHGPISPEIRHRFLDRSLYQDMKLSDIRPEFENVIKFITQDTLDHIDIVLGAYAVFSGTQLERASTSEEPYKQARIGYKPTQRGNTIIDKTIMREYYKSHIVEVPDV